MQLTSPKNPVIRALRKTVSAGRPTDDGLVAIEGPHLLEEAVRSGWRVERIFIDPTTIPAATPSIASANAEVVELSSGAFSSISDTVNSQGIIALVRPNRYEWQNLFGTRPLLLVLDGIQDPGNAGTLLRSAEAFGATGVVLLSGTVRITNGKFLRASAGSVFRIPFLENISRRDVVENLNSASIPLFALASSSRDTVSEVDLTGGMAVVVGSEGSGVSAELLAASMTVRIPVIGVESLNAAIAGSIVLFEAARQRSGS